MSRKKKELGLDGMEIQKNMRKRDYLSDGFGQLGLNLMSGIVGQ